MRRLVVVVFLGWAVIAGVLSMVMAGAYGRGSRHGWTLGVQESWNHRPAVGQAQAWSDSAYRANFGGFWNAAMGRPRTRAKSE